MKKLIIILVALFLQACAEPLPVETQPSLYRFSAIGFTDTENEIVKNAAVEWGFGLEVVTADDPNNSNISLADMTLSGLIVYKRSPIPRSIITINEKLKVWEDWESSRLRKVVLHELGHHIVYYNCGRENRGHLADGNIMAETPDGMSDQITERDLAYMRCEIGPDKPGVDAKSL